MARQQYEKLEVGDLVTKNAGPNKGKIMKVVEKYFGFDGLPCLKAKGVDKNIYIYHQNKCGRDGIHTCGAASCFKVLK